MLTAAMGACTHSWVCDLKGHTCSCGGVGENTVRDGLMDALVKIRCHDSDDLRTHGRIFQNICHIPSRGYDKDGPVVIGISHIEHYCHLSKQ